MAKYGGSNVGFFLVGGYSLLGDTTQISPVRIESIMQDTHTLGDGWVERLPVGVKQGYFTAKGWYDDAAATINEAILANMTTSRVVCIAHEGNTIGKRFMGFAGTITAEFTRIIEVAKLHMCDTPHTVTGEVEQGVILQELEQKTTTDWDTDSESVDNTTSSANGGAGYLQVTEQAAGVTGFIGKVRHSADDAIYADLVTFTNVTTEPAAQRVTVAGTVNRHLLFSGDITGTGTITVFGGFVRNP